MSDQASSFPTDRMIQSWMTNPDSHNPDLKYILSAVRSGTMYPTMLGLTIEEWDRVVAEYRRNWLVGTCVRLQPDSFRMFGVTNRSPEVIMAECEITSWNRQGVISAEMVKAAVHVLMDWKSQASLTRQEREEIRLYENILKPKWIEYVKLSLQKCQEDNFDYAKFLPTGECDLVTAAEVGTTSAKCKKFRKEAAKIEANDLLQEYRDGIQDGVDNLDLLDEIVRMLRSKLIGFKDLDNLTAEECQKLDSRAHV